MATNYLISEYLPLLPGGNDDGLKAKRLTLIEDYLDFEIDYRDGETKYEKAAVDGAAATTTAFQAFFRLEDGAEVLGVDILPRDALTADNSDYATVLVQKADGAGGAAVTVASVTTEVTGTDDWVANVTIPMTLAGAGAPTCAAGSILGFTITKAGNGVAVPALSVVVRYRVGGLAAATALAVVPFAYIEDGLELVDVKYTPREALTANDTNYATVALQKADGAGGSWSTVASVTTEATAPGSDDWVAEVPVDLPITDLSVAVAAGSLLGFAITKTAAGVVVPPGRLTVRYRKYAAS